MRFKKISGDEARNRRKEHFRGNSDVMLKASRAPASWNDGERSARFVMSSQAVDRYGDIVVTDGLDITEFEKCPTALLNHNSRGWSIGEWKNVEKLVRSRPPRMEGELVFHQSGGPVEIIDQAAWMVKNGHMRGASIGFIPNFDAVELIMTDDGAFTGGLKFNEAQLVECSVCNIPANQDALIKTSDEGIAIAREFLEEICALWTINDEGVLVPREGAQDGKSAQERAEFWANMANLQLYNPLIERPISQKKFAQMQEDYKHNRLAKQRSRELDVRRSRSFR